MRKQELRIIVGARAYKDNQTDYAGKVGVIELKRNKLRVQFIGVGNNELLENFNFDACRFFIAGDISNAPHAIIISDSKIKKHFSELGKKSWESRKRQLIEKDMKEEIIKCDNCGEKTSFVASDFDEGKDLTDVYCSEGCRYNAETGKPAEEY